LPSITRRKLQAMSQANTGGYHLVHANVAHARAPLDSPLMSGFVSQVDEVNSCARSASGFVGQPALPDEGAVYKAPFLLNVSVWESVECLDGFTHQGTHAAALDRRSEWFNQERASPKYVLYWVTEGHIVTEREVKGRLDYLAKNGATPYAFTFGQRFSLAQALAFTPVDRYARPTSFCRPGPPY
jgi:hypothetical protein